MSNILAVDCCLRLTGVALMLNGEVADADSRDLGREQSRLLPVMASEMLRRSGLDWNSLDYVALTNGPGYFTGIRVGAAYASGVAYACGAKIIPVSSLDMLAFGQQAQTLAVVYAGHGYVYASCSGLLEAGEYTLEALSDWRKLHPDVAAVSDDPERAGVEALKVIPDVKALCGLAKLRVNYAVEAQALKVNYYRAPQGVN